MCRSVLALVLALLAVPVLGAEPEPGSLEASLLAEGVADLAAAAESAGDARRGAVAFHQPTTGCNRCHETNGKPGGIGPLLTKWNERPTTAHLVESILDPSKTLRKGYETAVVVRTDGRQVVGLLVEATDAAVTVRDPNTGKTVVVPADDVEEWTKSPQSTMPNGLVNQLGTRQQFLDLVRYVREVADGGLERARELAPPSALLVARPLPEYESQIDHAALINALDAGAFKRGEAVYARLCVNCHGTPDRVGTLPTSRRFATEPLKNGSDPFAMYQTLTRGFGMMVPQHWMVPKQKYDVIHYLREEYLKKRNPSQYFEVTDAYLANLPAGETFGPEPSKFQPWSAMDYGPSLVNTYEFGRDGSNIAYKGIAVRLDGGAGGISRGRAWAAFEHDTLRLAGFWTGEGFVDWQGIHFDGRHNAHPHVAGDVHFQNTGPGWAHPETGSFEDDQRVVGRDDRRYGPLPRKWGRYEGLYHYGSRAIVSYRVGETSVLESPGFVEVGEKKQPVLLRSFEIGPRSRPMQLSVAMQPDAALAIRDGHVTFGPGVAGEVEPDPEPEAASRVTFDGATYLEMAKGEALDTGRDFTVTARIRTEHEGTIFARTVAGPEWVPGGQVLFVRGGRLCYDIGWVGVLRSDKKVADGKWHDVALRVEKGRATLFVDGTPSGSKEMAPENRLDKPVVRIGFCAPDFPKPPAFRGEIRDVRFFDSALAGASLKKFDEAKPVAFWPLKDPPEDGTIANAAGEKLAAAVVARKQGKWFDAVPNDVWYGGRTARRVLVAGSTLKRGFAWKRNGSRLTPRLDPGDEPLRFTLWTGSVGDPEQAAGVAKSAAIAGLQPLDLGSMTEGGPPRWPQALVTEATTGENDGPFAVDVLTHPETNPWFARVRLTGFDFFEGGDRAAVSAWDGDVWLVEGLTQPDGKLRWKRIASGLFQPLGVKIVDGDVYVTCRDQLAVLRDLNGDGETDFYQSFNSDHQVTEHFHEFAMGLQRDAAGNFYYAKSARHAKPGLVPHHGTLLRVSADGSKTDVLATGFRAANGVCLNPDGTFFVTDQEGHWTPKNRVNWVREGGFYGNMMGYHDVTDESDDAMQPPLCWITNRFDRSPAELLWVKGSQWGPLEGRLLNLSYGYGRVYVVPHEKVGTGDDVLMQGGVCPLPLPSMPTGLVRGRFHPGDGQLYTCGMFAWAGNQQAPGGFYRIRYTGQPVHLPVEFHARKGELELQFTGEFDRESAAEPGNYAVRAWSLKRSRGYGSKHVDERSLKVTGARVGADGRTVVLEIPDLAPTMGLSVSWELEGADGREASGELHGTIHELK